MIYRLRNSKVKMLLIACFMGLNAMAQQDGFLNNFVEIKTDSVHFYIHKFAVSAAEFTDFMEATGSHFDPQVDLAWKKDNMPATVTKEQADGYLALLTDLYLTEFRLPTEKEWELAAIGAPIPEKKEPLCVTCMVPNSKGVYGMIGNTWEWTSTPDPEESDRYFVIKGGDYQEDKENLSVNNRYTVSLDMNMMYIGFRMVVNANDYKRLMDVEEANSIASELLLDEHVIISPYQIIVDDLELDIHATEFPLININNTDGTFSFCCVHGYNDEMEIAVINAISFDYKPVMLPKLKRFQTLVNRIIKNNYDSKN